MTSQIILNSYVAIAIIWYVVSVHLENYLKPKGPLELFMDAILWPAELLTYILYVIAIGFTFLITIIHENIPRRKK